MKTLILFLLVFSVTIAGLWSGSNLAMAQSNTITLVPPMKSGGMPLMDALNNRKSFRAFQAESLSPEDLSNIFWAAFGLNRPDGLRTIPTSYGHNALAVYGVLASGVYLYVPEEHKLTLILPGDQTMAYGGAPLTILYAASVMDGPGGGFHAGSAYQNVALYCASAGLANVVKTTGVNHLKDRLTPPNGWKVLVVQSIGRPAGTGF
ncbi:MAG: nitroreductase family protein [Deltaproteobacteria bacterium]|jgi:hypothetical protein|nr:nitroreductase family protein [Deltaproteobacteria bacterium]